jgi:hypothetical protein
MLETREARRNHAAFMLIELWVTAIMKEDVLSRSASLVSPSFPWSDWKCCEDHLWKKILPEFQIAPYASAFTSGSMQLRYGRES